MIVKPIAEKPEVRKRVRLDQLNTEKLYPVLSVSFSYHHSVTMVTINRDDDEEPVAYDLSNFEIVDARLPDDWILSRSSDKYCMLMPLELSKNNLWDRYYDADPEAEKAFATELEKIKKFHSIS